MRGRKGGGVTLEVKNWIGYEELPLKKSQEQLESFWVRIGDQGNKGNLVTGVYYRSPDQGDVTDEAFLLQLQKASCSQSLALLGDFNHPEVCWKSSMTSCRQSLILLICRQIFKATFHRAQELSVPRCKKLGKEGKKPTWLSQELLDKLNGKKEQVSWEEYRDTSWLSTDGVRKSKVQTELNLARDAKNNK